MSHKLSTKTTKSDEESRLDVDNQTETGLCACLSSSSITPNGVGTHRVIRCTCHGFELRPAKARAQRAHACLHRQGGGGLSLEEDILTDRGSWHTGQSSKSIFSTMTPSHVTVNGRWASIGIRLPWSKGLGLESAIFAVFRALPPVWKGTRRKNWQEKYSLCWW